MCSRPTQLSDCLFSIDPSVETVFVMEMKLYFPLGHNVKGQDGKFIDY